MISQYPAKKTVTKISLLLFVNFMLFTCYPANVQAQENLIITGFQVKTLSFKPYREEGRISFFLNMDASINVELQDKDFNLVRGIELMGKGVEGENVISWDGRDEQGEFVKSGQYIFSITAQADNGSSAILSKDVGIDFEAPMGTELKPHITEIEGKPKKPHVYEAPERMRLAASEAPPGICLGQILTLPVTLLILIGNIIDHNTEKLIYVPDAKKGETFPKGTPIIYYEKDYEELAEMNREIDEYNAEIDAEIAVENREIDGYNEKIKDSITITMELVD